MIWIIILLFSLLFYGILLEPHFMRVRKVKISDEKGLKVAHFTDTHFNWHTRPRRFYKFSKHIKQMEPDLILFTGDLFDKVSWAQKHERNKVKEILTDLEAPLGKFAILGNHDFSEEGHPNYIRSFLEESGFTVLTNQSVRSGNVSLTGLDDLREGQPNFEMLPEQADFSLLMIHEPDTILRVEHPEKYDLVVAGHSHGGQIRLGNWRLRNDGSKAYDSGLYDLGQNTTLFVNAGIGLTFLPIRFGVPPEIVYYEI
ncbi:metallophosphoesterase [Lactococcus ileimucosae]|uniref:metallophosphoesterase n=1 Tax=Lactococcus ileimucosae TaxID=2941329 RepID=UPI00204491E7|nr:metallophosphoesterase [Lactococcus ileimucosae]